MQVFLMVAMENIDFVLKKKTVTAKPTIVTCVRFLTPIYFQCVDHMCLLALTKDCNNRPTIH